MQQYQRYRLLGLLALAACSDPPVAPTGQMLSVCHSSSASATIISIHASELADHRAHGDYVTGLIVDKQTTIVGDSIHFTKIGDAIAAARATRVAHHDTLTAACRITISVGAGTFEGNTRPSPDPTVERLPLVLDMPKVSIVGSFKMQVDSTGRATGVGDGGFATRLNSSPGLLTENLGGMQNFRAEPLFIVLGHPSGSTGDGAVIEGFVLQSGNTATGAAVGGNAVFAMRARDVVIRGNRIETAFSEPLDLRSSSVRVERNYITGRGGSCSLCLSGPGDFQVIANRQVGPGGIPGIFITPTSVLPVPPMVEQQILPGSSLVTATVTNNEVRNFQAVPVGVGLRVGAIGVLSADVAGTARVVAHDNVFANNRFGVIVEAAFPVAGTGLRGDIELTLGRNSISGNCQAKLLLTFARHTSALGLTPPTYLRSSTFRITLGDDLTWDEAWFAHPAGFENTLVVDGATMPNGSRAAYDATKVCSTD